ncbi:hypothetical protein [Lignipirellula cremea]|uniref:Uncharacterized protein n=1 Tax=Lignipirellula cremea TaxID=2528010 RepID=A0A518E200_9BACT|nr:hypothetical protein [Lignipirellula cremea]QDU98120.1 hypothetical protein Pla8534_59810 [Lignipirellula cremea]
MSPQSPNRLLLYSILLICGGCAPWTTTPSHTSNPLPLPRVGPDAVVLETAFVYYPADASDLESSIWSEVDEQHLDPELRRQLELNGLRCGLVGSQLPTKVQEILDQQLAAAQRQRDSGEDDPTIQTSDQQRIQCRAGHRAEIAAGDKKDAVVLMNDEGEIRGDHYPDAQCMFALRTFPQADGSVKVELVPEVQYGMAKMRWTGFDGAWKLDTGRERESFLKLRVEAQLSPGHTLILSGKDKGLGRLFFSGKGENPHERRLLLVRLVHTQHADLFAPETDFQPLETPAD